MVVSRTREAAFRHRVEVLQAGHTHVSGLSLWSRRAVPVTAVHGSNKAVAVGAVSFYVDHFVKGRISKFTYGVPCSILYNPSDPEHARREYKSFINGMGEKQIPDGFKTMLSRVRPAQTLLGFSDRIPSLSVGYQGPGGPRDPTRLLLGVRRRPTETYHPEGHEIHRNSCCPKMGGRGTRYSV